MNINRAIHVLAFMALFIPTTIPASGMPYNDDYIPPALKQWKHWVLHGQDELFCPIPYNDDEDHQCAWPSRLRLELDQKGGRFTQEWLVFIKGWVPLPGGTENWPRNVLVDGKAVPVVGKAGIPEVYLEPGKHSVEGEFTWKHVPEMINVPAASGLVILSINGHAVDFPLWDSKGRLWLQKREVKQTQEDRLQVRIYRRLRDTIPLQVTNKIDINVSGQAREIKLEGLLLERAVPMRIKCPLPVRFGPEGELLMQVKPGRWEVGIETRLQGPVSKLGPVQAKFGLEVWSFESRNHLRMVKLDGVKSVDPMQTNIPRDWKRFPAFSVQPGSVITFKEIRRGDPEPAPDQLHLKRTWWLDFNGRGFTIRDKVTGIMSRQWYLAMNPPNLLGHVIVDGVDQLITEQGMAREKKPGIELRKGKLNLVADSRLEASPRLIPAVGWDHDFQSVSAVLNLPPGWRLLTAGGVDVIPGTWFERWTLLDIFLILIISIAIWRLRSWPWGLLALVAVGLTYHEPGSPRLVWLHLLAALALLRLLSGGWLRKGVNIWLWVSVVTLLVMTIPFMVRQVRLGIYPQLENRAISAGFFAQKRVLMGEALPTEQDKIKEYRKSRVTRKKPKTMARRAARPAPYQSFAKKTDLAIPRAVLAQDPNALIQTGPGLPTWKWRAITMKWNGPVERNQQIRLWLLSPPVNLILSFMRVFLLALLIVGLINFRKWKIQGNGSVLMTALLALLVLPQMAGAENTSHSGYPPTSILQQLKEHLLEPPDCLPECADSPRMLLTVSPEQVSILFEVHAAYQTAVPLPGDLKSWLPEQVLLDDKPADGLLRDKKGVLWVLIPEGIHRVKLTGKTLRGRAFQIPLPLRPRHATVQSDGWDVRGIHPDGHVEPSLQLTPMKIKGVENPLHADITLMPFLHVERVISLGLTWQVRTTIRRITPLGTPVVLSVPLIRGESVTTAGIRVENGNALINMEPKAGEVRWISSLEPSLSIQLRAPQSVSWTETWILDASPIWHCETSGIPVIHHQDKEGYWKPRWQPWPGESIDIRISRPRAIPGQSITIDSAELAWTPGRRFNKGGLMVKIRASRGGQFKIELPEDARLQIVKINGEGQPIPKQAREVLIPLQPGSQTANVEWHQNRISHLLTSGPVVSLGLQAVNARLTFRMPANRWILWAGGPRLGPAVLFWSYLIVVILAACALGRISWTPLKIRHWLLLGLGLTQVHPLVAIMVVGWLLALGLRQRHSFPNGWFSFNMTQIILALWTIAALIGLYMSIRNGLLGLPDMQIAGNGSSDFRLYWTQDRIHDTMPQPWVLSLPLFVYRILMLTWALWLAYTLLRWLRWGWECFSEGGLWRKILKRKAKAKKDSPELEMG